MTNGVFMSRITAASNALLQGFELPEGDKTYVKILDAGLALFIEFGLRLVQGLDEQQPTVVLRTRIS